MVWDDIQEQTVDFAVRVGHRLLDIGLTVAFVLALYAATRFVRRRIRAYAEARGHDNNTFPALIDNGIRIVIYVIMGMLLLGALGVDSSALVTFVGLATAAVTLSLQDVLRNIFCGLYLLAEQPFRPGDRIRILAEEGRVERVDLRVTRIRNDRQELIMIPNMTVFNQVVGNRSTRRFRPFTLQLTGIQTPFNDAEALIMETLRDELGDGGRLAVHLLKAGPDGCDVEITIRRTETERQQQAIARSLLAAFPDATLTVVAR